MLVLVPKYKVLLFLLCIDIPELPVERANVVGQKFRFFHGGKMTAARHSGPAGYVQVLFCPLLGW